MSPIIHAAVKATKRTLHFRGKVLVDWRVRHFACLGIRKRTQLFYSRQAEKLEIKHDAKIPR
jgi:hypothetical protein